MQFTQPMEQKRRLIIIVALAAVVVIVVLAALGVFGGGTRRMNYIKLRCIESQSVTPFGDSVLYYDGTTLYCLNAGGNEKWNYPLGANAGFHAAENIIVAWVESQLFIIDRNGRATYNENLADVIQFARAGRQYVAAALGKDTSPSLIVKNHDGITVDSETVAYEDMLMMDIGFFGNGEYLWTTSLDVYGTVPNITLHTFRVAQMYTGEAILGENIAYAVLYSGTNLHVVDTRQLRQYDYRCTQSDNVTLVYGWQMVDYSLSGSNMSLLFAPSKQTSEPGILTELRLLSGRVDYRYTLPSACAGAAMYNNRIYAFSSDSVYRAEISGKRFTAMAMPMNAEVTGYVGMLSGGVALLSCNGEMYAVTLP